MRRRARPRRSASRGITLILALAWLACACDQRARRHDEAGLVAHRIEELQKAPSDAKQAPLEALRKQACSFADICALRDQCARGYELHVRATTRTAAIKATLGGDAGPEQLTKAARDLDTAQQDLGNGLRLAKDCTARLGDLRRELGL